MTLATAAVASALRSMIAIAASITNSISGSISAMSEMLVCMKASLTNAMPVARTSSAGCFALIAATRARAAAVARGTSSGSNRGRRKVTFTAAVRASRLSKLPLRIGSCVARSRTVASGAPSSSGCTRISSASPSA